MKQSPSQVTAETNDTDTGEDSHRPITKAEFEAIAAFRYAIRRFLRFSEQAARRTGITPQQHQLLLAIKGFPGRDTATVTELAERVAHIRDRNACPAPSQAGPAPRMPPRPPPP